jgi:Amt family ammonium transporter
MHLLALVVVSLFTFGGSFALYKVVDFFIPLRVEDDLEEVGLDLSQHGEKATDLDSPLRVLLAEEPVKRDYVASWE